MSRREITIHAFSSVKGGVGKSTLAVACAKLLAQEYGTCVLIDADMTGTSLADGLRLKAPKLQLHSDGTLDLEAARGDEFYAPEDVRQKRELRRARSDEEAASRKLPPVYFNDALLYQHDDVNHECNIAAMFWRHEREDRIFYLPSSSVRSDVVISMGWLYSPEYELRWQRRVAWLIDEMAKRLPELRHVIIDLPPGVFGFTTAILGLCADIADDFPLPDGWPNWIESEFQWRTNPCLVVSEDENDLRAALEFYRFVNSRVELRLVVNRTRDVAEVIKRRIAKLLPEQNMDGVNVGFVRQHDSTLGKIFRPEVNDLDMAAFDPDEQRALREALGLGGAR